jgi:hypothetical protein
MNDDYLENLLKEMKKEADELQKKYVLKAMEHLLEQATQKEKPKEEKPKTVWDLEENDKYYFINSMNEVLDGYWSDGRGDKIVRDAGNVFLTEEDALIEVQKREVEALLQKYGGVPFRKLSHKEYNDGYDIVIGYQENPERYFIYSDIIGNHTEEDVLPFAFETEMELYDAIEKIGEKRLIAYACGELYEE